MMSTLSQVTQHSTLSGLPRSASDIRSCTGRQQQQGSLLGRWAQRGANNAKVTSSKGWGDAFGLSEASPQSCREHG